jgi:hypothetical protein
MEVHYTKSVWWKSTSPPQAKEERYLSPQPLNTYPLGPWRTYLSPSVFLPDGEWALRAAIQWHPHCPIGDDGLQVVGSIKSTSIYGTEGCMPHAIGSWIADGTKGVRRLQIMEVAKGKGLPSEWLTKGAVIEAKVIVQETCLHIWTAVCDTLGQWLKSHSHTHSPLTVAMRAGDPTLPPLSALPTKDALPPPTWDYQVPDLSEGGEWHRARLAKLSELIQYREDWNQLWEEGVEALKIHRENYTPAGPKYLQVLWWEFPPMHQEAVRLGSSMRFLVDPGKELVANPLLTTEQTDVVCLFVEELVNLGVVRVAAEPLRRVCPLFVVPKPGQPGQWRCIADMKRGGQNGCCGLDPIILPVSQDILPSLYEGRWSGIADASKYFHNYLTLPQERDLIGIIHPRTGEHLWYVGLPTGQQTVSTLVEAPFDPHRQELHLSSQQREGNCTQMGRWKWDRHGRHHRILPDYRGSTPFPWH